MGTRTLMRADVGRALLDARFMPILRGMEDESLIALSLSLVRFGVRLVEIPLSSVNAISQVAELKRALPTDVMVGAGTVLDERQAAKAHHAGADFFVTPHVAPDVAAYAERHGLAMISGAMTPTEVHRAQEAGADFVKIFPASTVGASYISAMLGPFPSLRAIAVGGVGPENAGAFLDAGAVAVGIGGAISRLAMATTEPEAIDEYLGAIMASLRRHAP